VILLSVVLDDYNTLVHRVIYEEYLDAQHSSMVFHWQTLIAHDPFLLVGYNVWLLYLLLWLLLAYQYL
jgi:hypothetical protein